VSLRTGKCVNTSKLFLFTLAIKIKLQLQLKADDGGDKNDYSSINTGDRGDDCNNNSQVHLLSCLTIVIKPIRGKQCRKNYSRTENVNSIKGKRKYQKM
jgi:hypothetical protein